MLSLLFNRLRARCPEPYAREIAVTLFRDGFDPKVLDEMQALGSFSEQSQIFTFLQERKLKPREAAAAIRLATQRYYETRLVAEKQGWPLRVKIHKAEQYPPHEAYFLQLLHEAAESPPGDSRE